MGIFFGGGFVFFVWVCARSLGFRFFGFSARFGFLVFLVFGFLGFLATRLLVAFLFCTACWLLCFLGFLAFRSLGSLASRLLIASCIILYYVILNYIKIILNYINIHIYIHILVWYSLVYCIVFYHITLYHMKLYHISSYFHI